MEQNNNCFNLALVHHDLYYGRGFSRLERSWGRYRAGLDRLKQLGLAGPPAMAGEPRPAYIPLFQPEPATQEQLAAVHSLTHSLT